MSVYAIPTDKPFEVKKPIPIKRNESKSEFSKEVNRLIKENHIQVFLNDDGEPVIIITKKQVCQQ